MSILLVGALFILFLECLKYFHFFIAVLMISTVVHSV
jgi:hypothetical protein